jgi:histone H4
MMRMTPHTRRRFYASLNRTNLAACYHQRAIRRLARRGGVKRIAVPVYLDIQVIAKTFLKNAIRDAVIYMDYAGRKTLTSMDVVNAMKHQGRTLYGFA